jgi:CRP/FNR family cyclic AMP-dependent transcriptional regulator
MNIDEFIENPHPFLAGMSEEHLRLLGERRGVHFCSGRRDLPRGGKRESILPGSAVAKSRCRRTRLEKPATIQVISGGDVLGWSWLFPPHHWRFDARALKDTETIVLDAVSLSVPGLREKERDRHNARLRTDDGVAKVVVHRLQATRLKFVQSHKEQSRMAAEMAA